MSTARKTATILGAAVVLAALPLQAQTTFSGYSNGSFSDGTNSGLSSLGGLTFGAPGTPWTFSLFLGQTLTGIQFGTLFLDKSVAYNYKGTFSLDLIFTNPGGGNQVFLGALSGNITTNQTGQVNVSFDGPFTAALSGGYTVEITLDGITGQNFGPGLANNTDQAAVSGSAKFVSGPGGGANVAPEPITLVLLGTGLAGVGAAARRRRHGLRDD